MATSEPRQLPARQRIVIIGAGIVGNSVAYHLSRLGETEITLLDKGPLPNPGGSTGHASNFIFPVDHSKEMTALTQESMRQYKELDVYLECGGIEVARTEARMQELDRRMVSAKTWGIEPTSLVTPAEIKELVPFIDEALLLGGFYTPGAGVVDSLRAATIMRERAVEAGMTVAANTEVLGLDVEHGRIRRVRTDRGDIEADRVVIACGCWSPRIARMAGARIPLSPAVHQMIDIGPVARFQDARTLVDYPIVRDMDTNMYERQDGGGLEIGSYAHRPIMIDADEIPSIEESALSPTELPFTQQDFELQMEQALELMPEIVGDESVGRALRHQRPALGHPRRPAADGRDPRGVRPVVGGGDLDQGGPRLRQDGGRADGRRRSPRSTSTTPTSPAPTRTRRPRPTSGRGSTRASTRCTGSSIPSEQWESDRRVKLSPYYEREQELQAVFYEAAGWERPQWYESNAPLLEEFGDRITRREAEWESRWWSPIINAEHLAMRERAGYTDLTAFAIFDVTGPGALDAVQRIAMRQMDVAVGRVVYTPVLTPSGGFKADLTIMRMADDVFRVVTGGAWGMSDLKWFKDHLPQDGSAQIHDQTNAWTTLGMWGPRARDILAERHLRRRLPRGLPVRQLEADRGRAADGDRQPDLLRRRSRLGAVRPDRAGRAAVGHHRRGRAAARRGPGRRRRLRHHRPPGEVLPRLRRRARGRVRRRRGRHGVGQGQGRGLHRQGGARAPARGATGRGHVHADRRRPHLAVRRQALHARRRADPHRRRRARSPTPRAAAPT